MSCSLQAARKVLLVALALAMTASLAFAQGTGSSTTLSGLVADAQKAVIPGADVLAKNNATGAEFRAVTDEGGRFTIASVPPGTYTRHRLADGLQDRPAARRHGPDRHAGVGERDARSRPARGDRRRDGRHRDRADAERERVDDASQVKQIQQLPVITHTALDYGRQPAGRRDSRQQHPRFDHQRPADNGHQHHARRRQRAGQAGKRRLLHVHPADDGLGRGNHGVDLDARARRPAAAGRP